MVLDTINMLSVSTSQIGSLPAISGIYGLRSKTTGRWYIGQSVNIVSRLKKYRRLNCKRQQKIYNAIKKYGYDDFEEVVLEAGITAPAELNTREVYWSQKYNSILGGYNSRECGGARGKPSEETRKKVSLKLKGISRSVETKRKISASKKVWWSTRPDAEHAKRELARCAKTWNIEFPTIPFTIADMCERYPTIPYTTIAVRIRTLESRGKLKLLDIKQKSIRRSRKLYCKLTKE